MINPYNYVDKDNKCKCNPVIIGMTGPRGPQGRQGDIGPTARCNKSSIYFFKW